MKAFKGQKIAKGKLFLDWITKLKMKIENTELTQCFADVVDKPHWNISISYFRDKKNIKIDFKNINEKARNESEKTAFVTSTTVALVTFTCIEIHGALKGTS